MKSPARPIGRVEWEVLRYVTEHHPIRVRDVADHMAGTSGQARTTILTVLERLRKKGFLSRRKVQGVNHYAPRVTKKQVHQQLVSDFVHGVLKGSVSPFVAFLDQSSDLSDEEIDQLRALLHRLDSRRRREQR